MKKILVVLPVYNEERLLKRAVHSILEQTYTNFDLVIIDDASTDNSFKESEKFLYDSRVKIISNKKNSGCFYSKNLGIRFMESGEYDLYTTHDADDFSQPDRFQKAIDAFSYSSKVLGVQDLELRIGNTPPAWYNPPFTPMVNLAHAFFSKDVFNFLGYFDNTSYSGDEEYWNRLNSFCEFNGYITYTIQEVLYYAEITDDNMILMYPDELREIYRKKFWEEIYKMKKNNNFFRTFFEAT